MREPVILWEGPCAYAVRELGGYTIRAHSSNHVTHVEAGRVLLTDGARAERVCRRLNAYPRQTREAFGLL